MEYFENNWLCYIQIKKSENNISVPLKFCPITKVANANNIKTVRGCNIFVI